MYYYYNDQDFSIHLVQQFQTPLHKDLNAFLLTSREMLERFIGIQTL
jgi:hypothetical protein